MTYKQTARLDKSKLQFHDEGLQFKGMYQSLEIFNARISTSTK